MAKAFRIALFGTLFACTLAVFAAPVSGDHAGQSKTVDGMAVHLGLMPAEVLRQRPEWYPGHEQSKIPSGKDFYHVMLVLLDNSTGERIANAVVEARVSPLGLSGPRRPLVSTSVSGATTYCNYFRLSPLDTYVIQAVIRRPDVSRASKVRFVLERHL
jgi:hypothetical protein